MPRYPLLKDFVTSPIDLREVAFGVGNGITSSNSFTWYEGLTASNFRASYGSTISNDSSFSGIVAGLSSSICHSDSSVIIATRGGCIQGASYSVILGGNCHNGYANFGLDYSGNKIINGQGNLISGGSLEIEAGTGYVRNYVNQIYDSLSSSILGGEYNLMTQSEVSSMIGGRNNRIITTNFGTILGGSSNCLNSASQGVIVGGNGNRVCTSTGSGIIMSRVSCIFPITGGGFPVFTTILSGNCTKVFGALRNTIVSGYQNTICTPSHSSESDQGGGGQNLLILGGFRNQILLATSSIGCGSINNSAIISASGSMICRTRGAVIIGGASSSIMGTGSYASIVNSSNSRIISTQNFQPNNSSIIGGNQAYIGTHSANSTILGGFKNCIERSLNAAIIGSTGSSLFNSSNSILVGGSLNCIQGSSNSAIIGGTGLSLLNKVNMVLVPQLSIATPSEINSTKVLTWNDSTYEVGWSTNIAGGSFIDATEVGIGSTSSGLTSSNSFRYFDSQVFLDTYITDGNRPVLSQTLMVGSSSFTASSNANKSICNSIVAGWSHSLRGPNSATTILGGCCNVINTFCSTGASIFGGQKNSIGPTAGSANSALNSTIIGGVANTIVGGSRNSSILTSYGATLSNSNYSSIIGGRFGRICSSYGSVILGGRGGAFTDYGDIPSLVICGGGNNIISGGYYTKDAYYTINIGNLIECSVSSVVLGGYYNRILAAGVNECVNSFSSIIGGFKNYMKGGRVSSILGGCINCISSRYSSIVGGSCNTIQVGATQTSIFGGQCNTICQFGQYSSIINSCRSAIAEKRGLILNSELSYLGPTQSASKPKLAEGNMIINSRCSIISGTAGGVNFIMGGSVHKIISTSSVYKVSNSGILSGSSHCIDTSDNSMIIAGNNNKITNSGNSVIIGGENMELSGETKTVYVQRLKAKDIGLAGNTHSRVMIWSPNEYANYRSLNEIATEITQDGITGSTPYYTGSSWTWSSVNIYNVGNRVAIGATAPGTASSTLEVNGSLALTVKSVGQTTSSNLTAYTLTERDFTVLAWGGVTISLPDASLARHRLYVIKKMNQATQSLVDITPSAGDNIEGYTGNIQLVNQYDYNILQSDGYNMWIKLGGAVGFNL